MRDTAYVAIINKTMPPRSVRPPSTFFYQTYHDKSRDRHLPTMHRKPRDPSLSRFATIHLCHRRRRTTDNIL